MIILWHFSKSTDDVEMQFAPSLLRNLLGLLTANHARTTFSFFFFYQLPESPVSAADSEFNLLHRFLFHLELLQ